MARSGASERQPPPRNRVMKDGPYRVEGSVPLIPMTIEKDPEGECQGWRENRSL